MPMKNIRSSRRHSPILALTAAAASTDAISYLGLGHTFPANMTGNTVLLGIGIATADFAAAGRSACALGGFVLGAAIAATLPDDGESKRTTRPALILELGALSAVAGWWLSTGHLAHAERLGLIVLAGLAMGVQSGAVSRLRITSVTTTYITGTWTAVSTWIGAHVRGRRRAPTPGDADGPTHILQCAVLACYFGTAVLSGFVLHAVGRVASLLPVLAVLVAATTSARTGFPAHRSAGEAPVDQRHDESCAERATGNTP